MDDVDLLFECFKCGASPPQSAFRERKRRKNKLKLGSSTQEVSTSPDIPSSGSAGQRPKKAKDVQLSIEKFDTATVKLKANKKNPGNQFSPISSRKEIWATFPRQDEAMKFLVSTYKEFWQRYKNMDSKFHHHYEVIQEGLPCHLYFDLEFSKRVNAEKNGEKFTCHLIIRIPKTAFKDNSHAGAFVAKILSARKSDERFEKFFVRKDSTSTEPSSQLFVDTAVYSRNRCFRLALSSKAGKNSVLLPMGRFKCKDMQCRNYSDASSH
nr:dna-directed primase/polymerase protein [Quercus suber]